MVISDYDIALIKVYQRVNAFYENIKTRVQEANVNVDSLLKIDSREETDSPTLQQSNGAPPIEVKGKFTQIKPLPGVLDWSKTPTHLKEWFDLWQEWWGASWSGLDNTTQLLALIRLRLSSEWKNTLDNLHWTSVTINQLYELMDN